MAAFGSRGGGYGLDAELQRQREAKYDYKAEDEARAWIEAVTNEPVTGPFGDALRSGVTLCKLVNAIKPGSVRKVNESRMPFKQMENISNFLKSCRTLGVAEHSLFETVDLFEGKDIGLVVRCVFSLGSAVQQTCPEFDGPSLGAKPHQANKRVFNEQQKQQARVNASFGKLTMGSAHCMERLQVSKTGITFGADSAGKGDTTVVGKLAKGSHGIQERLPVDMSKSITFGNDTLGTGDTTVLTKSTKGSYGIMERLPVDKSKSITFGAENGGSGDTNVMTQSGLGSYGIMERDAVSKANDITFGASASEGMLSDAPAAADDSASQDLPSHKDEVVQAVPAPPAASKKIGASPTAKQATAECHVNAAVSPLMVVGSDVDANNKGWFQARSG